MLSKIWFFVQYSSIRFWVVLQRDMEEENKTVTNFGKIHMWKTIQNSHVKNYTVIFVIKIFKRKNNEDLWKALLRYPYPARLQIYDWRIDSKQNRLLQSGNSFYWRPIFSNPINTERLWNFWNKAHTQKKNYFIGSWNRDVLWWIFMFIWMKWRLLLQIDTLLGGKGTGSDYVSGKHPWKYGLGYSLD